MNKHLLCILLTILPTLKPSSSNAQCSWQTLQSDGFEYTTSIPDLMPGVCVHSTPQTFAAHSGTRGMYMNFIDCNGGIGTCAGAKVYERTYTICPGMPVRLKAWMTTTFAGLNYLQCDLKLVIRDANGVLLDSVPSLVCPFLSSGGWIQYSSATINPTTSTIVFSIFTNADGGQGNDLTLDDLSLEGCIRTGSTQVVPICSNIPAINIYDLLPANSVNSGTWSGPSNLGGGFLGTYTQGTNTNGNYYYNSTPYGTGSGCPSRTDTIIALNSTAPSPNLIADTSICYNQSITLNPGTSANYTHLWSTGASSASITVSNNNTAISSITYTVTVSNQAGCSATDSVNISFVTCSGIAEAEGTLPIQLYPNPANDRTHVVLNVNTESEYALHMTDAAGRTVLVQSGKSLSGRNEFDVYFGDLSNGLYFIELRTANDSAVMRLVVAD